LCKIFIESELGILKEGCSEEKLNADSVTVRNKIPQPIIALKYQYLKLAGEHRRH
jgi:hypothetical protein